MTDHKSWLWRRKPSEKTIVVADKEDPSSKKNGEEIHILLAEKAELERDLKDLNDKLSFALSECNTNDELAKKHAQTAEEALAGWEKAEAKALSLEEELNETVEQKAACEERTSQLEAALKECMQQLRFVREEKEQRIHDVLAKAEKDAEEKRLLFEEQLAESGQKIANLEAEITELSEVLFLKEGLIEELNQQRAKADADIKELLMKIDSLEKHNASLKYEVRVLEKELDIRNEEKEFNRRTADATHKQHLENVKKIAKLESECQRLRVLVRKRLPGPAALTKMRNEVQVLERGPNESRRRSPTPSRSGSNSRFDYSMTDYNSSPESPSQKINLLVEKVCTLEEENNVVRETLQKKSNELQISKNMYARASLKLSEAEAQLDEFSKSQMIADVTKNALATSRDLSAGSMSDVGSDDKASCAGSWASALISELEHFKDGKEKSATSHLSKSNGVSSDINLMDDFAEMEKLALVCVDKQFESSPISRTESSLTVGTVNVMGNEIVPVSSCEPGLSISISKVIKIIEGINLTPQDCESDSPMLKDSETPTEYDVRLFKWKTSEVAATIQSFLSTCYDLLHGKVDLDRFAQEVASTLEWIINHCFSLQEVPSMKDALKKHLDFDETRSECELEPSRLSIASTNGYQGAIPLLQIQSGLKDEIRKLKDEMRELESAKKEVEEKLTAMADEGKSLTAQLENQKSGNEDLNTQLSAARADLDDARQKLSTLESELENKTKHCEELEAKFVGLQTQLDSVTINNEGEAVDMDQDEMQHTTGWEIVAASEKLAACQESIYNLEKQLKALAPTQDPALVNHVISSPTETPLPLATITVTTPRGMSQRSSLLDKLLLAEDDDESPKTKEMICTSEPVKLPPSFKKGTLNPAFEADRMKQSFRDSGYGPLAIVPIKKENRRGLFKRLLWRKKKGHSKRLPLPFAT